MAEGRADRSDPWGHSLDQFFQNQQKHCSTLCPILFFRPQGALCQPSLKVQVYRKPQTSVPSGITLLLLHYYTNLSLFGKADFRITLKCNLTKDYIASAWRWGAGKLECSLIWNKLGSCPERMLLLPLPFLPLLPPLQFSPTDSPAKLILLLSILQQNAKFSRHHMAAGWLSGLSLPIVLFVQ